MKILKKIFKNPYIQTLICGVILLWVAKHLPSTVPYEDQVQPNNPIDTLQAIATPGSPGIHFYGTIFKESHPEIYGSYSYIVTDGSGQLNITSQSDTFYGSTHTVMEVRGSSTVNWSSTYDQFGKDSDAVPSVTNKESADSFWGSLLGQIIIGLIVAVVVTIIWVPIGWLQKRKPKFKVFLTGSNTNIYQHEFRNDVEIDLRNIHSINLHLAIYPEIKYPFFYSSEKMQYRVELIDNNRLLRISLANPLPGLPTRYDLGRFSMEPNVLQHISMLISPTTSFKRQVFPILIYFEGKLFEKEIIVSIRK